MRNAGTQRTPTVIRILAYGRMGWLLLPFAILLGDFLLRLDLAGTMFANPRFLAAFWTSPASAFLCAIIAGFFAIPAAYALAFGRQENGRLEKIT